MLSIQNIASRAWIDYKKTGLNAEELSGVASDSSIPASIRKEAVDILEIRRIPDVRATRILAIFKDILKTCNEIKTLENEQKKK
jgi:hypothetical protein